MSETPQARLETDVREALRARDRERLATLRLLLSAVKNRRIELGDELDDAEFLALVEKSIKQRRDAADQYRQGGRTELAEREEREVGHLEAYLPEPADPEAVRAAVREHIEESGAEGPRAMGEVMKAMRERFAGAIDGKTLAAIVRDELG